MTTLRRLAVLPLALMLSAPQARAADVSQDDAVKLETQLRGWLSSLVAPALDVGPRPIRVSPDGSRYRIEIPEPDLLAATGLLDAGLAITLKAASLDGGRWALDDLRVPQPLRVHAPKELGDDKAGETWEGTIDQQEFHGVFDPSFATTSSFDMNWQGYRTVASGQTTSLARSSGHTVFQPTGEGRIKITSETTGEKLDAKITAPNMPPVAYRADKVRSSGHVDGLQPAGLAALIRNAAALIASFKTAGDAAGPTPEQRKLAHDEVDALSTLLAGVEANWSMEGIKIEAMGQTAGLRKIAMGGNFGAPEGKLSLGLDIALEGLETQAVPPGVMRDYLPRKIALKPHVSGFPAEDAARLLQMLIDADPNDPSAVMADALAVLAANPVEVAIDDLVIDLGRATITASGSIEAASPTDVTGEAEISMTGLDALMKRANTSPELKEIAPVLLVLKGLGKQDGQSTVWSINYEGGKVTVNDTDVSNMMGNK